MNEPLPQNIPEGISEILRRRAMQPSTPKAIIFVDGKEFMVCETETLARKMIAETAQRGDWKDIHLYVYREQQGAYLHAGWKGSGS